MEPWCPAEIREIGWSQDLGNAAEGSVFGRGEQSRVLTIADRNRALPALDLADNEVTSAKAVEPTFPK